MAKESLLDKARKIINEVDAEMRELFVKRMKAAEMVAEYKKERGLAIFDGAREDEVIKRNSRGHSVRTVPQTSVPIRWYSPTT